MGETLIVKREPTTIKDKNAVAIYIYKENIVVGHAPYNITLSLSHFLRRI